MMYSFMKYCIVTYSVMSYNIKSTELLRRAFDVQRCVVHRYDVQQCYVNIVKYSIVIYSSVM